MNGWQGPFGLTNKAIFIGGRGPAQWRRDLARCVARLDVLQRACAWLQAEILSRPNLRQGPLLGACLTILTGYDVADSGSLESGTPRPQRSGATPAESLRQHDWDGAPSGTAAERQAFPAKPEVPRPQESGSTPVEPLQKSDRPSPPLGTVAEKQTSPLKPEAPRPRRSRPTQPELRKEGNWDRVALKAGVAAGPSRRQELPPLQLATKASQRLLDKLVGPILRIEETNWPRQGRPEAASTAKTRVPPPAGREAAAQQDWLHHLARRAENALHQKALERHPKPSLASADQPRSVKGPWLAEQWAMPLQGEAAPADLLVRLVRTSVSNRDYASGEAQAGATSRHSSGAEHPAGFQPLAEPLTSTGSQVGTASRHSPGAGSSDRDRKPASEAATSGPLASSSGRPPWEMDESRLTAAAQTVAPLTVSDQPNGAGGPGEAPAGIAPPREAPTLPSLRPPRRVSEPISPLAAAIIKQEARPAGEAAGEDNLTALSAKIKRILDEEARRHGIDV